MKVFLSRATAGLLLCGWASAASAGSVLRVACDGDNVGADVSINGSFKGDCPVDIQLSAGTYQLSAVKKAGAERIRDFATEVRIGEGVAKKVSVELSEPHLTAEGQRLEAARLARENAEKERLAAERRRQEAAQQARSEAQLDQERRAAQQGEADAMLKLGIRYAVGDAVAKDAATSKEWLSKAAEAGSEEAAFRLSSVFKSGNKNEVDDMLRILRLPRGEVRAVDVAGEEAVRKLVATDAFFALPGSARPIAERYMYDRGGNLPLITISMTSSRQGNSHLRKGEHKNPYYEAEIDEVAALGGLMSLRRVATPPFFSPDRTTREWVPRVHVLEGQPFPLVRGRRFSIAYDSTNGDGTVRMKLTCGAAEPVAVPAAVASTLGSQLIPMTCYYQYGSVGHLERVYWDEQAGYAVHTGTINQRWGG